MSQLLKLGCIWCRKAPEKNWEEKNKKIFLCRGSQMALGKEPLPTARPRGRRQIWWPWPAVRPPCGRPLPTARAIGKCYIFAEGLTAKGTASAAVWPRPTLPRAFLCREPGRRQSGPLPSASLCRRPGTRQRILCRRRALAVGKDVLCRWLIPWPSAKNLAVGNDSDSGSGGSK